YSGKSEWDHAIEDYTKAISLDATIFYVYGNRGLAYSHKGDLDRAIEDYSQAIQLDGKNAVSWWINRCWARAITRQLEPILRECNPSPDPAPNGAGAPQKPRFCLPENG